MAPAAEDAEARRHACGGGGGGLLLAQLLAQPEASFDEFVLLGARGGVRALPRQQPIAPAGRASRSATSCARCSSYS